MTPPSFTAIAEPEADRLITRHLGDVRSAIRRQVGAGNLAGVALFGGYGRREGGVVFGNSGARPHNNYDLLVVLEGVSRWGSKRLERRLRASSVELATRLGVGVDISAIGRDALRQVPPQIFWYDVRRMHVIVDGPDDLLSIIPEYRLPQIPQPEKARLLLNRAALLAINRLIWRTSGGHPSEWQRKVMIKHVAKAILGYGDAVLLASGGYEVSYRKKVLALSEAATATGMVNEAFLELHHWATNFRFRPDYSSLDRDDIAHTMESVLLEGQRIHRWFEEQRLGALASDWADYLDRFDQGDTTQIVALSSLRSVPRRVIRNLLAYPIPRRPSARSVRWLTRDPFLRLMATAPAALYSEAAPPYRRAAERLLGANGADLLSTFVDAWARVLDPNAGPALRSMGLR